MVSIPKLSSGGNLENEGLMVTGIGESENIECAIIPKKIKKKRFIKLLMSKGVQRNEANILHKEYMKLGRPRSEIGMLFFMVALTMELEKEIKGE